MADLSRIEELKRRVQRDPASIAFAQLAEEYRRAGRFGEAIDTCETGLARHPGYLSARVTLGRALLETGDLDAAQAELKRVLRAAPENLAALRGLAEIHHRRGDLQEALDHYRAALEFARQDPELTHLVEEINRQLGPGPAPVTDGLSFEEAQSELLSFASSYEPPPIPAASTASNADAPHPEPALVLDPTEEQVIGSPWSATEAPPTPDGSILQLADEPAGGQVPGAEAASPVAPATLEEAVQASATAPDHSVEALERWLEAILADRDERRSRS